MPTPWKDARSLRLWLITVFLVTVVLGALAACGRKSVSTARAMAPPNDNSYMDLLANSHLRIVVPVAVSANYQLSSTPMPTVPTPSAGTTIVLSAPNLAGYDILHYSVQGTGKGKVRLRFLSADITRDGKTLQQNAAPPLPFSLPSNSRYIRLIYLTRSSPADHNMAIAASPNLESLHHFTDRLRGDPSACQQSFGLSCTWVPAGIAVRPE